MTNAWLRSRSELLQTNHYWTGSGTDLPSSPVISYTLSSGSVLIGVWMSLSSPAGSPLRLSSLLRDMVPGHWYQAAAAAAAAGALFLC